MADAPTLKSVRLANYLVSLRKELLRLSRACGLAHPALVTIDQFGVMFDGLKSSSAAEIFGYQPEWTLPSADDQEAVTAWANGAIDFSQSKQGALMCVVWPSRY